MPSSTSSKRRSSTPESTHLPLAGLLALAAATFVGVVSEALPAGVLPEMSADLGVSESRAGLLVTAYAISSALTAIPLMALTRGSPRRGGIALGDGCGYATRMVLAHQAGRALAIAMVGSPLAFSVGVTGGTLLAGEIGWRITFSLISVFILILIGVMLRHLPQYPGETADTRLSLGQVARTPGLRSILLVTGSCIVAHTIMYAYIWPYPERVEMGNQIGPVLFAFGASSIAGIRIVGALIERRLRVLAIASSAIVATAMVLHGIADEHPLIVIAATVLWGLAFGGSGTIFQTAAAKVAGASADVAQSMIVTIWNTAIGLGALIGGLVLDTTNAGWLPWMTFLFLAVAFGVTFSARQAGFSRVAQTSEVGTNQETTTKLSVSGSD